MKNKRVWTAGLFALILATGCDNSSEIVEGQEPDKGPVQEFTLMVESNGESYLDDKAAQARQSATSATPKQAIDKVALVIVRNDESAEVVYHTTLEGWNDTQNIVSRPYDDGSMQGRKVVVTLKEEHLLEDGKEYLVYAIGYQSGTYGGYVPFKDVEVGKPLTHTETVTVPDGGRADEIFAGSRILHVKNGKITTAENSPAGQPDETVVLRRQVAGTFGYFTRIPTEINGTKVAGLRLVSTRRNGRVILGGFRSNENPEDFNLKNVANGMAPDTEYDARLFGSTEDDAFVVYEVKLKNWFPGNAENPGLPLDMNSDGYLDGKDTNWQVDGEKYPDSSIKLRKGSVFGDCFWVASATDQNNVASGVPTLQMQLLDEKGQVLKHWNVSLQEKAALQAMRTVVTLDGNGQTVLSTETTPETEHRFSIVRNRLYAMGTKSRSQSHNGDEPIDLSKADKLVVDVENDWESWDTIVIREK